MNKTKKSLLFLLLTAIFLFTICVYFVSKKQTNEHLDKSISLINSPTLFLHGYGGVKTSMQPMINSIEKNKLGKQIATVYFKKNDTIDIQENANLNVKNPLINVVFEDNENGNPVKNAISLKQILLKLNQRYHFKSFNVVAHSMGTSTFSNYLLKYHSDNQLPKLNKYVALASISNGFIGGGQENTKASKSSLNQQGHPSIVSNNFNSLKELHKVFPKNASVLNIFGNLDDDTNSDGRVPNNSSKSLKYLTTNAKKYQEIEFHGKNAQHSALKRADNVEKATMKFLFK